MGRIKIRNQVIDDIDFYLIYWDEVSFDLERVCCRYCLFQRIEFIMS